MASISVTVSGESKLEIKIRFLIYVFYLPLPSPPNSGGGVGSRVILFDARVRDEEISLLTSFDTIGSFQCLQVNLPACVLHQK